MIDAIVGAVASGALLLAGYVFKQLVKVEGLDEKVNHIRERVDALYDHLIEANRRSSRADR